MKKLLLITILLIGLVGCGYERVNGYIPEARVVSKITSEIEGNVCYSKYYIQDNTYFAPVWAKEYTYVLDTCSKWNVGDTIKLNK